MAWTQDKKLNAFTVGWINIWGCKGNKENQQLEAWVRRRLKTIFGNSGKGQD